MLKSLFTLGICLLSFALFAQTKTQFILIVRSKTNARPSTEAIQTNIKHWQAYMGELAKSGKLASGYRPGNEGETISGTNKTITKGPYTANDEVVSSFLIINAKDMDEAKEIAAKCPVFELDGSLEIRAVMNVAGR